MLGTRRREADLPALPLAHAIEFRLLIWLSFSASSSMIRPNALLALTSSPSSSSSSRSPAPPADEPPPPQPPPRCPRSRSSASGPSSSPSTSGPTSINIASSSSLIDRLRPRSILRPAPSPSPGNAPPGPPGDPTSRSSGSTLSLSAPTPCSLSRRMDQRRSTPSPALHEMNSRWTLTNTSISRSLPGLASTAAAAASTRFNRPCARFTQSSLAFTSAVSAATRSAWASASRWSSRSTRDPARSLPPSSTPFVPFKVLAPRSSCC
mmetsp:Transcript_2263/g.5738  ORF Transcript_2263/g.5738 Transcript_2263/m.5738 type:complete len:265 (+) Transcript_2263:468-1262(+)